ncbi:MAG: DUF4261 domain-containing protein [Planctomycetia bacterium]|nr:DUF4261 domain-containing protein [Planctomycetia bacterium]
MNHTQMEAAKESMIRWLSHPHELGEAPTEIECAGEFDLHGLHYYIFKFKTTRNSGAEDQWLLAVCGGYEKESDTEHCGHIFSEMEPYDEENAIQQATNLVEMIRSYWIQRGLEALKADDDDDDDEDDESNPEDLLTMGSFQSFVLLEKPEWDKEALQRDLEEVWGITVDDEDDEEDRDEDDEDEDEDDDEDRDEDEDNEDEEDDDEGMGDAFILRCDNALIMVVFMPCPIPEGEAEYYAQRNFMWPGGEDIVKQHQAHVAVSALMTELPPKEVGTLIVKVLSSCCRSIKGVVGVYANETVYQPQYYVDSSKMILDGVLPICNLVWVGLRRSAKGICAYTSGMQNYGFEEMEIIDSSANEQAIYETMYDIVAHVLNEDVVLKEGETLGFSPEKKCPITRSQGVAVEGMSLKIGFSNSSQ